MVKSELVSRRDFLRRTGTLIVGGSLLTIYPPACSSWRDLPTVKRTFSSMGTFVEFTIVEKNKERALEAINESMTVIRKIHNLMSVQESSSQISEVNRKAGSESLKVEREFMDVAQRSLAFSAETQGLFDITVLPLLQLWGFMDKEAFHHIPDEKSVQYALEGVGYNKVKIDPAAQTIGLTNKHTSIDVGGIGKGYAVDRAVAILREKGIQRAIVNAGGELYLLGAPEGEPGWLIGIQDPMRNDKVVATLRLKDVAIATSGNYENYVEISGHKYGHIFDPRKGAPSDQMLSASIIATTGTEADALSKPTFLSGTKQGVAFIESRPNTECVLISKSSQSGGKYEYARSSGLNDFNVL